MSEFPDKLAESDSGTGPVSDQAVAPPGSGPWKTKWVKIPFRERDAAVHQFLLDRAAADRRSVPDWVLHQLTLLLRATQPTQPTANPPSLRNSGEYDSQPTGTPLFGPEELALLAEGSFQPQPKPKRLPAPGSADELMYEYWDAKERMAKGYDP
jgi:hypothetical protein